MVGYPESQMLRKAKIVACVLAGAWLASACFEIAVVPTPSMERTVLVGDHLLVFKLFDHPRLPLTHWRMPRLSTPSRGTLVSFHAPGRQRYVCLKRVVAVPGDRVEIRAGALLINGRVEPNGFGRSPRVESLAPRTLGRDQFYVVGDNRDLSEDSRDYGPITREAIVGSPVAVLWSVRARTVDLVNTRGNLSAAFYFHSLCHVFTRTRWSRTGLLL